MSNWCHAVEEQLPEDEAVVTEETSVEEVPTVARTGSGQPPPVKPK